VSLFGLISRGIELLSETSGCVTRGLTTLSASDVAIVFKSEDRHPLSLYTSYIGLVAEAESRRADFSEWLTE